MSIYRIAQVEYFQHYWNENVQSLEDITRAEFAGVERRKAVLPFSCYAVPMQDNPVSSQPYLMTYDTLIRQPGFCFSLLVQTKSPNFKPRKQDPL